MKSQILARGIVFLEARVSKLIKKMEACPGMPPRWKVSYPLIVFESASQTAMVFLSSE